MTTTPSRDQVTMRRVDVPKASDVLAHQVREAAMRRMQRHVHGFAATILATDPREEIQV